MTAITMNASEVPVQKAGAPRMLIFILGFILFTSGACGIVQEYILATMSTYILGNSIEQFSIIVALMLLMMGFAGYLQGSVSDKYLIQNLVGVEILLALIGGFAPLAIYYTFGTMPDHFLLIHYSFVCAVGFLIGFEIPIVVRILATHGLDLRDNLKVVYFMEYVGSFVGAIIWVYALLKFFPLTEISFIVACSNFLVALVAIIYFMRTGAVRASRAMVLLLVFVVLALSHGYSSNRDWSFLMEQKFYEDPIIAVHTTKYQHLVLTEYKKTGDVRLYINGNTQFSSLDESRYHDLLVHPAMTLYGNADNVLVLGGGDGLALRELLKYENVQSVDLVDLDPEMVKFASTNSFLRALNKDAFADARVHARASKGITELGVEGVYMETGRLTPERTPETEWVAQVSVYNVDADRFVGETHGKKWDVIIIDFPDPSSVELAKLYSKEFFLKLKWHMTDKTLVAIQSTSPYHAKEAYLSILRTMKSAGLKAIPYHQNIPSFGDWGYVLAWKSDVSVEAMKKRIYGVQGFQVETDFITPEVMVASLAFGKGELVASKDCINKLMQPCLLNLYTDYSWLID